MVLELRLFPEGFHLGAWDFGESSSLVAGEAFHFVELRQAGREGEGAFAVTYSVTGPISDPQISVNPLAVLAPGFIRTLFNALTDDSADAVPATAPN